MRKYRKANDAKSKSISTALSAQQSAVLFLEAKTREIEKRISAERRGELRNEDAYLCLEVLSLCSHIYSPVQKTLVTMRPLFQRIIYPTKYTTVTDQNGENRKGNVGKNVNKVNVEIQNTDEDLKNRRPYYSMYRAILAKQQKVEARKIFEGGVRRNNGHTAKANNTVRETEDSRDHEYDMSALEGKSYALKRLVEQNTELTKACEGKDAIIRDLNFDVLDLKKQIFCIKRQAGKSHLELKKDRKLLKGMEGFDGVNEAKNEQKRKGYSSKFQDSDNEHDERSLDYDDGKNATNITKTDWGERKKRRNLLLIENLHLQEELRMANLQIDLLKRKVAFQS